MEWDNWDEAAERAAQRKIDEQLAEIERLNKQYLDACKAAFDFEVECERLRAALSNILFYVDSPQFEDLALKAIEDIARKAILNEQQTPVCRYCGKPPESNGAFECRCTGLEQSTPFNIEEISRLRGALEFARDHRDNVPEDCLDHIREVAKKALKQ